LITQPRRNEPAGSEGTWIARLVNIQPGEMRATLMACVYFFFLLASYFILRSIRDAVGVQAGVNKLPYLFSATFVVTLVLNPLFARIVSKLPVRQFIPIVYRIFGLLLLTFGAALKWLPQDQQPIFTHYALAASWIPPGVSALLPSTNEAWLVPAFWVYSSVFSLFVPSVFWGFMSDTFQGEQSKRLYGFIGVGGTLGALTGSGITALLAERVGTSVLLLMSACLLELGVQCVARFPASFRSETRERESAHASIGGGSLAGFTHVLKSPYLLGICAFMMLYTIGTTILYVQQAEFVKVAFLDAESRTAFLAKIDFVVQILTIGAQIFVTGRVIKWLGVGITLAILPVMSIIGFASLGFFPTIALFVVFSTLRRAGNNAFSSPGREVLFTVVPPEDKYKAKNLIDTFVYRSGDQIGAWSMKGLTQLGFGTAGSSLIAAPMSLVWFGVALWLGHKYSQLIKGDERISSVALRAQAPSSVPATANSV
jgi:AAA family ATP:ADP antiporter